MAILETQDANILDADAINWRLVIYPILALLVVVVGGFAIYYYLENQRESAEVAARQAFVAAKTLEALEKVADQFPSTTHATLALLGAGNLSFEKQDYPGAAKDFQKVIDKPKIDPVLLDSAQLGLASALEGENKIDEACKAYLTVARRGNNSPYAPFAFVAAAQLYEKEKNQAVELEILTEASGLGGDSPFLKEARTRLEALNAASQPASPTGGLSTNAAPAPAPAPTTNSLHF